MASDSYPRPGFNGGIVTEANYERLASPQAGDGLIGSPSDPALAYADGIGTRTVKIRANRGALVRGFRFDSGSTDVAMTLPANTSGSTRLDLIVLRLTRATWRVEETFIAGVAGSGTVPTPVNDASFFDLPIASVTVANNATALGAGAVNPLAWYLGSDGQILCTASTRPPHERGRRIFETDSARALISNGVAWLPAADDSGPVSLTLASGWSSSVNVLHRVNGQVFLALSPQRTGAAVAAGATVTLGTLSAAFRPRSLFEGLAYSQSSGPGRYTVNPSGVVQLVVYEGLAQSRFVNLHPVTFPAVL